jgi:uncharacterized membrane protein (DUF485 family)
MGFLLEIILEFFIEFVLQIAAEILIELPFQRLARTRLAGKTLNTLLAFLLYFGLGVIIGWLSTLIFPNSFIRVSRLHGISLLITPVLAGLTMWSIGWIRQRQGKTVIRLDTFGYGFLFALGMALIRFFFTR